MLYIWTRLPREVYNPQSRCAVTNLKPMETCVERPAGVGPIHNGRFDSGADEVQPILVACQVGKPNVINFVICCPRLMFAGYFITSEKQNT